MLSGPSVQAQSHLMPVSPDPEATGEGFSPELKQAIADGAQIPLWEVDSFIDKQRLRIDLTEKLERDFPNTLSGIWMDDFHNIHMSATSEDVLRAAKVEDGGIETHLVKYSYQDLIDIKDRVVGSIQGLPLEDGSFVGIDTINNLVSIGYDLRDSNSSPGEELTIAQHYSHLYGDAVKMVYKHSEMEHSDCKNGWNC